MSLLLDIFVLALAVIGWAGIPVLNSLITTQRDQLVVVIARHVQDRRRATEAREKIDLVCQTLRACTTTVGVQRHQALALCTDLEIASERLRQIEKEQAP